MLGSDDLMAVLGTHIDNTDHEAVKARIRECTKIGLSLLFCHPGTKIPADLRTVAARKKADKEVQEQARLAGRKDWAKVKAPSGLTLATSDNTVLQRYLKEYIKVNGPDCAVNLAIELGGSRIVVVDCDTAAQVKAFLNEFGAPEDMPPFVASPGQQDRDGNWVHQHGGHFYFTLPDDVELPTNLGAFNWPCEDSFAVLWDSRYVLIPPSTRPEGAYECLGRPYPIIPDLLDAIIERAEAKADRIAKAGDNDSDDSLNELIDDWASGITWAEILEPLGWVQANRPDNCSCDIWTAPGPHSSPKSATAHEVGCTLGRYTDVNLPFHIWTDNPGEPFETAMSEGTRTFSKLQVVALTEYGGNVGAAMDALGVKPDLGIEAEEGVATSNLDEAGVSADNLAEDIALPSTPEPETQWCAECEADVPIEQTYLDADAELWHQPDGDTEAHFAGVDEDNLVDAGEPGEPEPFPATETPELDVFESEIPGTPLIATFDYWRDTPPPEYVIDGLLEHGGLCMMFGPAGVGKSCIALDMACHIATGKAWQGRRTLKTRVLYLPGEGRSGAIQRLRAWEAAHKMSIGRDLLIADSIIDLGASKEAWGWIADIIIRQGVGLVIFDTFARMSLGIEENSATDVGKAIRRFDQIRKLTNAGALVIHHSGKTDQRTARGSSALKAAVDSELFVGEGHWDTEALQQDGHLPEGAKTLELDTTKQKNAEQLADPMPLLMLSWQLDDCSAPIITGPTGTVDPMEGEIMLARPTPQPTVELAVQIRDYLDTVPKQGATRADLRAAIRMDAHTASRKDAPKHWKQRINEAVDLAFRYDLIETVSGTDSGSRYRPGISTRETARTLAQAEALADPDDERPQS